jgi:hypothetical protein
MCVSSLFLHHPEQQLGPDTCDTSSPNKGSAPSRRIGKLLGSTRNSRSLPLISLSPVTSGARPLCSIRILRGKLRSIWSLGSLIISLVYLFSESPRCDQFPIPDCARMVPEKMQAALRLTVPLMIYDPDD